MAWVAVDEDGSEYVFTTKPCRERDYWINEYSEWHIELPKGSIKKLIGRELSWSDEPVKLE